MSKREKAGEFLLVAERVVVIVAGVAALFPLWQFWAEREARQIDRAANFITAFQACENITPEPFSAIKIENPAALEPPLRESLEALNKQLSDQANSADVIQQCELIRKINTQKRSVAKPKGSDTWPDHH